MFSKVLAVLFLLTCPAAGQSPLLLGKHPAVGWNVTAPHVLIIYHGLGNPVTDYYLLATHFGSLGYAVVMPTDCEFDIGLLPGVVVSWVKDTIHFANIFAQGRPLAVLGHSMGGGAAMAASRFMPQFISAYVAVHPAPILSRRGIDPNVPAVTGPILFIDGTLDGGFTGPAAAKGAYDKAGSPKALINVKGHGHMPITDPTFGEIEGVAAEKWLDCFARKNQVSCDWLNTELCLPASGLEWCLRDPPAFKPLPPTSKAAVLV